MGKQTDARRDKEINFLLDSNIRGDGHCIEMSREELFRFAKIVWENALVVKAMEGLANG